MTSRPNTIAIVIGCAFFMQNLDSTIVTTALPQIAASMGVAPVRLNIIITAYFLSNAVFIPISGWLADRFGVRTTFQAAILVFVAGSTVCALSNTVLELTAARIVQAAAGAMIVPVGRFALLRSIEKSEMVRAIAFLTVPTQVGSLIGPILGGAIVTYASWRWIFLINIPFGLIGVVLVQRFIEDYREPERRPLDWLGFTLAGISLFCLLYALDALGQGEAHASSLAVFLIAGLAAGWLAVRHIKRAPHPLLDLSLLKVPTFSATLWGGLLYRVGWGGLPFVLPLMFQVVFGMDALTSGILIFATAIGSIMIRIAAPGILARVGFRALLVWNGAIAALSMLGCVFFTAATPVYVMFLVLLVGGIFQALQVTSLNSIAYADIEKSQISSATSIAQLVIRLGKAFGVAAAAFFMNLSLSWRGASHLGHADVVVSIVGITVLTLAAMPYFLMLSPDAGDDVSGHSSRKKPAAPKHDE